MLVAFKDGTFKDGVMQVDARFMLEVEPVDLAAHQKPDLFFVCVLYYGQNPWSVFLFPP